MSDSQRHEILATHHGTYRRDETGTHRLPNPSVHNPEKVRVAGAGMKLNLPPETAEILERVCMLLCDDSTVDAVHRALAELEEKLLRQPGLPEHLRLLPE